MSGQALLLTCEHAVNTVPRAYRYLFAHSPVVLNTHRGIDLGALALAQTFAKQTSAPLRVAKVTRLLVELNRSLPKVFSEFAQALPTQERTKLLQAYYHPHRQDVMSLIAANRAKRQTTLHIGVHSFTPKLNGQTRNAEIGLLFDPRRPLETRFCHAWQRQLRLQLPSYRIRRNYPYLGRSDGLTTSMRKTFGARQYLGIELEVNQALTQDARAFAKLQNVLAQSLVATLSTTTNLLA